MSYLENLSLYFVLLLGILVVPGVDMLLVLTNALAGGRRTGLATTVGIMAAGSVHVLWGALAVGLVLTLVPSLLSTMLFIGAAYLAWIGFTLIRSSITVDAVGRGMVKSSWVAFRQGAITGILNPKAYVFVLSVFPQFLTPRYGAILPQAVVMGILTVTLQFVVYGGVAVAASKSRNLLVGNPQYTVLIGRCAGYLLFAIAVATAWHGWRSG